MSTLVVSITSCPSAAALNLNFTLAPVPTGRRQHGRVRTPSSKSARPPSLSEPRSRSSLLQTFTLNCQFLSKTQPHKHNSFDSPQ